MLIVGAGCSRICAAKKHNADLPKQPIAWHVNFKNGDGILARWPSRFASAPEVEGDAASMGTVKIDLSIALAA